MRYVLDFVTLLLVMAVILTLVSIADLLLGG